MAGTATQSIRSGAEPSESFNDRPVDAITLIEGMNRDLAGEYQAIQMYIHYSAKLTGPYRKELRALFQAEIPDEQGHVQFLADKIAVLGGEPTTEARPVPHADTSREMLERVLEELSADLPGRDDLAEFIDSIRQASAALTRSYQTLIS